MGGMMNEEAANIFLKKALQTRPQGMVCYLTTWNHSKASWLNCWRYFEQDGVLQHQLLVSRPVLWWMEKGSRNVKDN